MTRKDYVAIAEVVAEMPSRSLSEVRCRDNVMHGIMTYCASDNPSFDRTRFIGACTVNDEDPHQS